MIDKEAEKNAHDEYYQVLRGAGLGLTDLNEFMEIYRGKNLKPFYEGGTTKGFVRQVATHKLLEYMQLTQKDDQRATLLDAGSGQGGLSIYMAGLGFNVIGVDLSTIACNKAKEYASCLGLDDRCSFLAEDLGKISIPDNSIDAILGHASLHHFIKYPHIPKEFARVLKPGGKGFFADSFGENLLYHLFHDKEAMKRLGDVILTKPLIEDYFYQQFDVELIPTDWFVMFDKIYQKILPRKASKLFRKLSRIHFIIDRTIPSRSRIALRMSGSVVTIISNRK